jgi:adenosylhomocysteine nucleosidase
VNPKTQTLVCFALQEEAAVFRRRVGNRDGLRTLITGIGRQNAEKAVREFLKQNAPHRVFTCGFAGGLSPELKTGDVVFFTDDASLATRLAGAGATPVKFHCAARIVTTAAEKTELRRATNADAVEMESAAIHAVCRERGIPCATVRAISDAAPEDLPLDFNRLGHPDLSLHYGKLALAVAKSPGKIPALLRLRQNSRLAAERLAAVLAGVIWP